MDKPGDFFVGVTDLFSVLLPGSVLTFFALRVRQSLGRVDLFGLLQLKEAAWYMAFIVSAFLLGHLADMIGATILGHIYDLLYADFMRYRMASCLIIIALSFLRYSDLRCKSAQRVYRLYVISQYSEPFERSAPGAR